MRGWVDVIVVVGDVLLPRKGNEVDVALDDANEVGVGVERGVGGGGTPTILQIETDSSPSRGSGCIYFFWDFEKKVDMQSHLGSMT